MVIFTLMADNALCKKRSQTAPLPVESREGLRLTGA